jgi:hypothetical protein
VSAAVQSTAYALSGPALDEGQREVLGAALSDAIAHRSEHADGHCADCRAGACDEAAADASLAEAYLALGRELAIRVER